MWLVCRKRWCRTYWKLSGWEWPLSNNNSMDLESACIHQTGAHGALHYYPCSSGVLIIPETVSAAGGVYSSIAAILAHIGQIKHNNQLYPHRYPFTPVRRESVLLKDTSTTVAVRIRTHILKTRPSERKPDVLNCRPWHSIWRRTKTSRALQLE